MYLFGRRISIWIVFRAKIVKLISVIVLHCATIESMRKKNTIICSNFTSGHQKAYVVIKNATNI